MAAPGEVNPDTPREGQSMDEPAAWTADARALARMTGIVADLAPESPVRKLVGDLANAYDVPGPDEPRRRTLSATIDEAEHRLAEAGAERFLPMTPEQWAVFGRGLPFGRDELLDHSAEVVRRYIRPVNGRPKVVIANHFHTIGIVEGALAEQWSR